MSLREAPLLSVRNLGVALRRGKTLLQAVDGVSFDIAAGEALGLVGESGCGKSLTAASLFRLSPDPPVLVTVEQLSFAGEELARAPEARFAALRGDKVGMVFQDPTTFLNPVLTIGAQLEEPLRVHRGLSTAAARLRAIALLNEVGIPEPARRLSAYPHELSGGLRQRVLIAVALSCDPLLLIADEPTTALDVTLQAQILTLLDRERRARGMGLLFITHDLGVVARLCERVAVMYAGRIVETGFTREVFRAPHHPYTAALLGAVRALDRGHAGEGRLPMLRGNVPALEKFDAVGCRFRERCDRAAEDCATITPRLGTWRSTTDTLGRVAPACHHPLP